MAIGKKTTKKTATKAPVKKTVAVKPTAVKSTTAKKAPAKKVAAKKPIVSQEKFYAMVSEAAYFSSQNDGNKKSSTEYWMDAEAAVSAKFDVA